MGCDDPEQPQLCPHGPGAQFKLRPVALQGVLLMVWVFGWSLL